MDRYQLITIYRCDLLNPLKKVVSRKLKENSESLRGQLDRASDISRKKKQNSAGFSGANSRKNRPISRDFRGKKSKFLEKSADFTENFGGKLHHETVSKKQPISLDFFWQISIPANLRRSKIWRLSILHYTPLPSPPNVNSTKTPIPPPVPTNCLRTLYDILHEVYGIKMRFHHCNDKLIFVID